MKFYAWFDESLTCRIIAQLLETPMWQERLLMYVEGAKSRVKVGEVGLTKKCFSKVKLKLSYGLIQCRLKKKEEILPHPKRPELLAYMQSY